MDMRKNVSRILFEW